MGALTVARPVDRYEDAETVKTLKDTVCKGATDSQFKMFVEICKGTGLNPFLKEIWFVPGVGVIAARDGYLRVANENPNFDGMETKVERDVKNVPIKATCCVWRKDRSHPITCEAYFNEYKKSSGVWNTYPSAMISKVAEALALKRSFSINGVVSEEEVGFTEEVPKTRAEKVNDAKAVAERKIAEMKGETVQDAEFTDLEVSAEMDSPYIPTTSAWIKPIMEAFAGIKEALGEAEYRSTMEGAGYKNKNALMKAGQAEAKRVYKIMRGKMIYLKRRREDLVELAELQAKLGAAFHACLGNGGITWADLQQASGEDIIDVLAKVRAIA